MCTTRNLLNATLVFALLLMLGVGGTAHGVTILAGSDYLSTPADGGSFLDFSVFPVPPLVDPIVQLEGNPTGPGNTDTVVRRQGDATLGGVGTSDTVAIEIVSLSLTSVNPISFTSAPANFFDVFVELDLPSAGWMEIFLDDIVGDSLSGHFDSFFDLFFTVDLFVAGTSNFVTSMSGQLSMLGSGLWSSDAPPGSVIVPGPPGDTTANTHIPLGLDEFDFYVLSVTETHPDVGVHVAEPATPEPATLTILGLGLVGLAIRRMKRGA